MGRRLVNERWQEPLVAQSRHSRSNLHHKSPSFLRLVSGHDRVYCVHMSYGRSLIDGLSMTGAVLTSCCPGQAHACWRCTRQIAAKRTQIDRMFFADAHRRVVCVPAMHTDRLVNRDLSSTWGSICLRKDSIARPAQVSHVARMWRNKQGRRSRERSL